MATNVRTTSHASYQSHKGLNFNRKNRKGAIASDNETNQINLSIVALNKAKSATTEKEFLELVSTAFNYSRHICRSRML